MNNKLGIYYAYWQKNWEADIVPLIARASRLEFDILEINAALLQDQTKESLQKIKDAASLDQRAIQARKFLTDKLTR